MNFRSNNVIKSYNGKNTECTPYQVIQDQRHGCHVPYINHDCSSLPNAKQLDQFLFNSSQSLCKMSAIENTPPLTRSSVQEAHALIKPYIYLTPTITSTTLTSFASTPQSPSDLVGTEWEGKTPAKPVIRFFFKCENQQRIGAFKARGAFHALARLGEEGRKGGVVTHSSGISTPSASSFWRRKDLG